MKTRARNSIFSIQALTMAALLTRSIEASAGEIRDLYDNQAHQKAPTDLGSHISVTTNSTSRQISISNITRSPSYATHGISEIGIERSPCYGTCPTYTLIVKQDGTFRYKGVANVERIGEYTGRIDPRRFGQLAQFIKDSAYMELDDAYTHTITDQPTAYTTVMMNGTRKVIKNYANSGPTKLWAIEQLIDDLMGQAQWSSNQKPP